MKISLDRKILLGFIACALILFGVAIFSFKNSEKFIASNAWVDHTNQVLNEFGQILVYSVDAETGARGFVVTGEDKYLEPFTNANAKIAEHVDKLKELTSDNPVQQKNIEQLEKQLDIHIKHLDRYIELRRKDFEKAKVLVASGEGKRIEDEIRRTIDKSREIEQTLLVERKQASDDDAGNFNLVFGVLLLIIISILSIVYKIITTNLIALKKAENETAAKNWLLTGSTELNEKLKGDQRIEELANNTISFLCTYLKATIGAVYLFSDKDKMLALSGHYAFSSSKDIKEKFALNEGLIGQAAREQKQISLTDINEEQIHITSSVLNTKPKQLLITPFLFER